MDSYLDFPLFAEKVATFMDHLEDVNESESVGDFLSHTNVDTLVCFLPLIR